MSSKLNAGKHFPRRLSVQMNAQCRILVKQKGYEPLKKQYEELTAFLQVVDGTVDSAASLLKAATVKQLLPIDQLY